MTNILIAGDFCPRERIAEIIETEKHNNIFTDVAPVIKEADYSILNFECPVIKNDEKTDEISKNGPHLKSSEKAIEFIKATGFNMVTLANNHFFDYGQQGVEDTLKVCGRYNIDVVGGGLSLEQSRQIVYKNIDNRSFAFINCCEHEFSIATQTTGGSNPLNVIEIYYQIQEAKKQADYVILIIHGGHEYYQLPSPRMKETYRFFADAGASAIVNHHQHCFSGYEVYNGIPVFYGLGNFCFDNSGYRNATWNEGYMVQLFFDDDDLSFELHPYRQCDENPNIRLLDEIEKKTFDRRIKQLNEIIADDAQLSHCFADLANSRRNYFMSAFQPYYHRVFRKLGFLHLISKFASKRRLLKIQNFVCCESHHDILQFIFKIK